MTRKGRTQIIDGDYYSSYFNPEVVRQALRFIPGKDDIVQMTFPASGTHWMQQITQLIVQGGRSAGSYREFAAKSEFLEFVGSPVKAASPRLLTTHMRPGQVTVSPEAKYVYVARNPWDVCASLYDLQRELQRPDGGRTFDDYVPLFLEGLAGPGDYLEHVRAGFLRKDESNVFFVTYEEMAADHEGVVLRLADFLGREYGQALRQNSDLLREVVSKSSFDYMRHIFNPPTQELNKLLPTDAEGASTGGLKGSHNPKSNVRFLRKAKVGRWRDSFSKSSLEQTVKVIDSLPEPQYVQELWKDVYTDVLDAARLG